MSLIKEIKAKNDLIEIILDEDDTRYLATIGHFSDKYFRNGDLLSLEDLEWLKKENEYSKAYLLCLRKIASKDRTIKEIRDILYADTPLNTRESKELIDYLCNLHYLDDDRYLLNGIELLHSQYLGKNKVIYTLADKGIPKEKIIEQLAKEDETLEIERGKYLASHLLSSLKNKPLKAKKQALSTKLFAKGYDNEIIEKVINSLEIPVDQEIIASSLEKCYKKAYKRYSHKQSGVKLRNSLFRYLVNQGFDYQNVSNIINESKEDIDD